MFKELKDQKIEKQDKKMFCLGKVSDFIGVLFIVLTLWFRNLCRNDYPSLPGEETLPEGISSNHF